MDTWKRNIMGREKSKYKDPGVGSYLASSKFSKVAVMAKVICKIKS